MNKRIIEIIEVLANPLQSVSINYLAEKYEVSTRTIRNDLNSINDVLVEGGLTPLKLLRGAFL